MPPLIRAIEVLPAGKWPGNTALDRLVLNYDERHRRRLRYVAEGGTTFLLDLPRATVLRAGDGLRLEDGSIVLVEASPEQLVEMRQVVEDVMGTEAANEFLRRAISMRTPQAPRDGRASSRDNRASG